MRSIRSRFLVACTVALTLLATMANPALVQTPVPDNAVRIMTYNIHHGSGNDDCTDPEVPEGQVPDADCALNLDRVAEVIAAQDADIIGLQEVDRFWARSGGVDQPAQLGEMLDMNHCYGANLDHAADDHADEPHQYGVAILTTYEIVSCENTFLPIVEGEEQRGLLDARVMIDGVGEVAILNTHFDHKEPSTREMQSEAVAEYLLDVDVPVVLMGDLNAEPDDGDLSLIQDLMTDAWAVAGDSPEGMTYPAHPEEPLEKRIDYIFVSPGVTVLNAEVIATEDALMAADHLPVIADVVFDADGTPVSSPMATPVVG